MRDIKTKAPPDCDIVLCGNKADLDNDRVVTYEEGQNLAEEYGVQFFETSALTGQQVEKMFTALATTIKQKRVDALGGTPTEQSVKSGDSKTVNLSSGEAKRKESSSGCC